MITARVTLQSTPADRFVEQLEAIRRQLGALPDAAVAALLDDLERLRRQVLGEIAAVAPGSFTESRLVDLRARLETVMAEFAQRYGVTLAPFQDQTYALGAELAARPLVESGVAFHVPQISRRQLEILQGFQADLISGATEETIRDITQQLRLGALRGESVPEVLARISTRLTEPGPFGTLATRAEAIARTELGRVQALATQAGLEETQRFVPDLQKQWRHSGNTGPDRRQGHVDAHHQTRPVDERYRVRPARGYPYEALLYPRDPAAGARNTVNCGCVSVPWREAWSEAMAASA